MEFSRFESPIIIPAQQVFFLSFIGLGRGGGELECWLLELSTNIVVAPRESGMSAGTIESSGPFFPLLIFPKHCIGSDLQMHAIPNLPLKERGLRVIVLRL